MFLVLFASVHWVFSEGCGAFTESCGDRRACIYVYPDVGLRASFNVA
jgi:hypothetical protein